MYVKCLTIAHTDKVSQKNNPGETVRPIRLHHQLSRMRTLLKLNAGSKTDSAKICTPRPNQSGRLSGLLLTRTHSALHAYVSSALQATISGLPRCKNPSTFSLFPSFCYSPKFYFVDFFFLCFTSLVSITGSYVEDESRGRVLPYITYTGMCRPTGS